MTPHLLQNRGPRRFAVALGLLLLPALGPVLVPPSPAAAHPFLVQVVPGPGTVLTNSPPEVVLAFSEAAVLAGSSLELEDASGRSRPLGELRVPGEGPGLAATVPEPLDSAVYRVRWVVLGDDGHTSAGNFDFAVAGADGRPPAGAERLSATGGPAEQAAPADGPVRIALRWAGLLGASLLLGGRVLAGRLRGRLDPGLDASLSAGPRRAVRLGWWLALAGAASAAVAAAGAGAGGVRLSVATSTTTGAAALLRLAAVGAAGVVALLPVGGPRERPAGRNSSFRADLLGAAGALYLGAEAVSGHVTGVTGGRVVATVAQVLHLTAAGLWVGGMAVLVLAVAGVPAPARRGAWPAALRALSPVAVGSAVVVVATGTFAAVREVDHPYFLRHSAYGQFLLGKLTLVAAMLMLGALGAIRRSDLSGRRSDLSGRRSRGVPGSGLRLEAALGVTVLLLAATLAGVAQGRGQPLPAQRGSVLAGPAFANAVVGGGVVRVALVPASPGRNRITVLPAGGGTAVTSGATLAVSLTCPCAGRPVQATLARAAGPGSYAGDVDLPAAGVWQAALGEAGAEAVSPVALRVDDGAAPGAPPVVVAAPADLSGRDGRRCRSLQLGMVLALGFKNADGGVGGRKVVVAAVDDGGDPAAARAAADQLRSRGAHVAAPCGRGAGASTEVLAGARVPVVLADPQTPLVDHDRVFRTAGDPYAEGWAVGRILAQRLNVGGAAEASPKVVAVVGDAGDDTTERAAAGLRAALRLAPSLAAAVEKTAAADTSAFGADTTAFEVRTIVHQPGTPLDPLVADATDNDRYVAALLRNDPNRLAPALDAIPDGRLTAVNAVFVGNRAFDETFYRGSKLGRRGDVLVLGEVAPDSNEALLYTKLISSIFPGERASIDGLRGFLAGRAIAAGLGGGTGGAAIAERLRTYPADPAADGLVSGWSPGAPATGAWRFLLFKGSFVSSSLTPGAVPDPGRFFEEGAWSRVATRNVGLCGPQERFAPEPCTAPDPGGR